SFTFTANTTGSHRLLLRGWISTYPNNTEYLQANTFYIDNVLIKDTSVETLAFSDYYPFGMPMPNRVSGANGYRYAFQGQEKDPETGKEAFKLRLWDGRIGRWLTTDPKKQYASPYLAMGNNPISRVDPDGGEDNPIYGSDGSFRGVDEFGLDGEAIVYDGEFTNGMSQSEILDNGGFFIGDNFDFLNTYAGNKIMNHYMDIPNRPDFDGVVTFWEARKYSKNGGGDLYIDVSKMDFESVNEFGVWDFKNNKVRVVNFFNLYNNYPNSKNILYRPATENGTLSFVYGRLKIELIDVHTGAIKLQTGHLAEAPNAFDRFDFRNGFFHWLAGSGEAINFYGYGTGKINLTLNMGPLWDHPINSKRRH
ncbi:RHS repeat-associated core domain-containing protein, partial [Psychroserpens luteolus]|uniref:RHS repeat-associated core domain-containing protein n=1 Tax=Psychroserpens luteolus TaxID=2855840 RepID=UPI001E4DE35F